MAGLALCWSIFQLWQASPLPAATGFAFLNADAVRAIHLAFAFALLFLTHPWRRAARPGWPDMALGLLAVGAALYVLVRADALALRPGAPTSLDLCAGIAGLVLLLEAARRAFGWPLPVIALCFLAYVFFGDSSLLPEILQRRAATLDRAVSHLWLTSEGVFGVPLGVSASTVFLFVLFGALLDKAGGGAFFIRLAWALLGRYRGGPAKAAVLASGLTGLVSGSSIANVVTTGSFTIPLMKRFGLSAEKAAAIEVAASTNGQILPPVMGAAAFLMVEYTGLSYVEIIRAAMLPALLSYCGLLIIVHLEACKAGLEALPAPARRLTHMVAGWVLGVSGLALLAGAVWLGLGWIKALCGAFAFIPIALLVLLAHLGLTWIAARAPELAEDPDRPPPAWPVLRAGLDHLLPLVVLVWALVVERLSPGLAAFWAIALLAVMMPTRPALMAHWRGGDARAAMARGGRALRAGLTAGAESMVGIAIATATAGIVVGAVTMTGLGLVLTDLVEALSMGHVALMLGFTAIISVLLGFGLPTTANYIVVATLTAPVLVTLGAAQGLVLPLVAVHLFVFYFGLMADSTPPVGLATFAAAGIARADPLKTGIQALTYDLRTALLPFIFIFNHELLLIGVDSLPHLALTVASALAAMLCFAAGTQGWLRGRLGWGARLALLLAAFTLLRPGFWRDQFYPPFAAADPASFADLLKDAPEGSTARLTLTRTDFDGKTDQVTRAVTFAGPDRLDAMGIMQLEDGAVIARFGGPLHDFEHEARMALAGLDIPAAQPHKHWFLLPGLLLLALLLALPARPPKKPAF